MENKQETEGKAENKIFPVESMDESGASEVVFDMRGENHTERLAGLYYDGVQYYDLKKVRFMNNAGVANIIDLLKSFLKQGVKIRFINMSDQLKAKIKAMGLDKIIKS